MVDGEGNSILVNPDDERLDVSILNLFSYSYISRNIYFCYFKCMIY